MRIAILSCFPPYRGGISQFNTSLYQELAGRCTVGAFNFKRQYPEFLFPGKTQYIEDGSRPPFETSRVLDTANPLSYISTARTIRAWKPDLLLMRYWMPYFAPSQGYVARHMAPGCKVISILDNVIPHEHHFFDRPLTTYYINGQDGFVVLCNAVRDDLLRLKPDARHIVSPHPIYSNFGEKVPREQACRTLGIDPGKKTLLFFGLIREYKGLDILLEAFSTLDDMLHFVSAWLNRDERLLSRELFEKVEHTCQFGRTYGWSAEYGPGTLYHTGVTGTSILMDVRAGEGLVLLTNRVHPSRDNAEFLERRKQINRLWLGEE